MNLLREREGYWAREFRIFHFSFISIDIYWEFILHSCIPFLLFLLKNLREIKEKGKSEIIIHHRVEMWNVMKKNACGISVYGLKIF